MSFAADFLWKQAGGKDKERSQAAVGGEDLSEEDTAGAHFAPTGLLHRVCRACDPGKKSHNVLHIYCFSTSECWLRELNINGSCYSKLCTISIVTKWLLSLANVGVWWGCWTELPWCDIRAWPLQNIWWDPGWVKNSEFLMSYDINFLSLIVALKQFLLLSLQ